MDVTVLLGSNLRNGHGDGLRNVESTAPHVSPGDEEEEEEEDEADEECLGIRVLNCGVTGKSITRDAETEAETHLMDFKVRDFDSLSQTHQAYEIEM